MLALFLAALLLLVYGIYRGAIRWGTAFCWWIAAAVSAVQASGLIAARLWGPLYSWNFAHLGWDSLPRVLASFGFSAAMALWFRNRDARSR